jgi:S-adenosylmethionine synthetase
MILTFKKIQHNGADRKGMCFRYSNEHNICITTTMIYTHITNKAINRIQSPIDRLNLKTEDKNDKKMTKKYNNFGGLTSYRLS